MEDQLTRALPKMADEAHHPALKEAFKTHLSETCSQLDRLDRILAKEGVEPREHEDESGGASSTKPIAGRRWSATQVCVMLQ